MTLETWPQHSAAVWTRDPAALSLAFVDVESTGGAAGRIIEVAVVGATGATLEFEWSTLIAPGVPLRRAVTELTGIEPDALAHAPPFAAVLPELHRRLAGRILVAHNASFDYRMLRAEARRAGAGFAAPVLCTLSLARALFPERPRHHLDALIEAGGYDCGPRHRALADARVLQRFWAELLASQEPGALGGWVAAALERDRLPAHWPAELEASLPDGPGVFLCHDASGAVLQVGRGADLRAAVLALCRRARRSTATRELLARTQALGWIECSGPAARLAEARLIAEHRPPGNARAGALQRQRWTEAPVEAAPTEAPRGRA